jgi:transcriptional regulator of acetoin/glycerol metabolism
MDIEPRDAVAEGLERTFRRETLHRLGQEVSTEDLKTVVARAEARAILTALHSSRDFRGQPNKSHTAALLGISRVTLYKKLRRHGIT